MSKLPGEQTVLVTGGNGFLGQHLVRELQVHDLNVKEIRVLDRMQFSKKLDYPSRIPVISVAADLRRRDACREAFRDVDCVFHCAAVVSYHFPPDEDTLYQHNILATENVIELCVEQNVKHLVFTSTTEAVLQPYMKSTIAIVVNQTESKALPPGSPNGFLIPGYPASKRTAEDLVLKANGRSVKDGDVLKTVALRPTLLYGEEDRNMFFQACQFARLFDCKIPRIFGSDSMQQVTYVGNAAWAHVTAKDTLMESPNKIAGLPVFITDDTTVQDNLTLLENLSDGLVKTTRWRIPAIFTYLIAAIIDIFVRSVTFPAFKSRLPCSLTSLVSYLSSVILFSRLRASIHLDYTPLYSEEESLTRSRQYYSQQLKIGYCRKPCM